MITTKNGYRSMKYTLIINNFYDNVREQLLKLGHFLSENNLKRDDGYAIVFHKYSAENIQALDSITELMPVSHVRYVYSNQYVPEICLDYLTTQDNGSSLYLFIGDIWGNELCARLSVRLKGLCITDITSLCRKSNLFLAKKKICSGHILGSFELTSEPCLVSINKSYDEAASPSHSESVEVSYDRTALSTGYELQFTPVVKEESFTDSPCILVCGLGLSNKEHVLAVENCAGEINLPVAGSRPCVMNAWLPVDRLIGVSGTILKNNLAILLGVSGAPAFYTGVEKCKHIISINTDKDAPITKKSDLAICGDCTEIFTKFSKLVKEEYQHNE